MNMTVPSITAFYTALLGLLGAGLTVNVIVNRVRSKVDAGDGGVAKLAQAIRAHANFAEQAKQPHPGRGCPITHYQISHT